MVGTTARQKESESGPHPVLEQEVTIRQILLGNEAIACGLLESACTMATSYPGTPASEILGALVKFKRQHALKLHLEWSINEKVAFEVALANSFAGRRSAVIMKQVGLNVAADPLMSAAYTGVKGGFVVVVADDPGPHSSQTEQDSRFMAMAAKLPVLDPSSPAEARDFVPLAMTLSEKYEIPVMLRPTTRVCHARQDLVARPFPQAEQAPLFEKNPARWAATPKFRLLLHRQLNEKLEKIALDPQFRPHLVNGKETSSLPLVERRSCIVASGAVLAYAQEVLLDLGLWDKIPVYKVSMPYPLSPSFRDEMLSPYQRILVLEESYPVIELQLQNRERVSGRTTGTVPSSGELLPEVVETTLRNFCGLPPASLVPAPASPGRRPTLCAGCPHRAAFFAIKKTFPKGLYPSDIGCYTLGLNLGAVDTVLCMGASISQATGFYHAYRSAAQAAPEICATIGDSTFFHAGIPALVNAVVQGARFVLVILDNSITAMTGHQPTPASGKTLDGVQVPKLSIPDLVRACGVGFVAVEDPYRIEALLELLKKAKKYSQTKKGGVAVVIARHPCLMDRSQPEPRSQALVKVTEKCKGCGFCVKQFECPALLPQGEKEPIRIDQVLCSGCGVCVCVCPHEGLARVESCVGWARAKRCPPESRWAR
jgi:indolepyruvate ferredoxin oxidoreductase alpha subunit